MAIKLANSESMIKAWTYAHSKQRLERKEHSLIVTDKRIIASSESNKSVTRREIYLQDVKSMDYNFTQRGIFGAVICLIFGILTAVAIIGIFFIAHAVKMFRDKKFILTITTEGFESFGLEIGASSFFAKKRGKIKVRVNKEDVFDIIDELGAIVLDVKSANK